MTTASIVVKSGVFVIPFAMLVLVTEITWNSSPICYS